LFLLFHLNFYDISPPILKPKMPQKSKFKPNTINQGDGLELLRSLPANSAKLFFFDPQYEKVKQVLKRNYPLAFQPDEQIRQFCREIARELKPSGFCLL